MIWILVCFIPLLIPFFLKHFFNHQYTWGEVAICCFVTVIISCTTIYTNMYAEMADKEVLNGKVTSKSQETVSCRHSYSCNCYNSCRPKGGCTRICSTCYEHSKDYDWNVYSTIGTFTIDTIDRQGVKEPPRYTEVNVNEPVAKTHYYLNYVKGAKNSLFNMKKYAGSGLNKLPQYPITVYDYYKLRRTIDDNVGVQDKEQYNQMLSDMLKDVGNSKQVNVVLVFTKQDQLYAEKLRTAWLSGKKNDIVVVVGVSNYPTIKWVNVFSWSKNPMLNISMRDDIISLGNVSPDNLRNVIQSNIVKHYVRKPMEEYAYLKNSIEPSTFSIVLAFILSMLFSIGFSYYAVKNEIV